MVKECASLITCAEPRHEQPTIALNNRFSVPAVTYTSGVKECVRQMEDRVLDCTAAQYKVQLSDEKTRTPRI